MRHLTRTSKSRWIGVGALLVAFSLIAPSVQAFTIRYALVIGNNIGVDTDGSQPYPPLIHAEEEAAVLREKLVGLSNFDAEGGRTRLLLGAARDQVYEAFRALAAQKARDEAMLGDVDSIFLLYFTGHGLEGRLLMEDGPLASSTLATLFNSIGADLSVGIFDACYSGSLDGVLSEKGISATPGLNMVRELPGEVLSAKGSVWFVSSGAGQASYEDKHLGGVFTHFFTEALAEAPKDGPGITLDRIWQYAREQTIHYTSARDRKQVPEQFIAKLRVKAPIYFSFPVKRSATLVLSEALSGKFALTYADGQLTEVFDKSPGTKREVPVYPGSARLILLGGSVEKNREQLFQVREGGRVVLDTLPSERVKPALGQNAELLSAKGLVANKTVRVTRIEPGTSLLLGASYSASFTEATLLNPRHRLAVPLRFDFNRLSAGIAPFFGLDRRSFDAWGYDARAAGGRIHGGYGMDLGPFRLGGEVGFLFAHIWQAFDSGDERQSWEFYPSGRVTLLGPRTGNAVFEFFGEIGPTYLTGAGKNAGQGWYLSGGAGLAVYYRLF